MVTCFTIHIHTARIRLPLKKMLPAQDAASARRRSRKNAQVCYRRREKDAKNKTRRPKTDKMT